MKSRFFAVAVIALLASSGASAEQTRLTIADGQESAGLAAQGWLQVDEGIWQRTAAKGGKETYVSGAAGLAKVLPSLRDEQRRLQEAFWTDPSEANKRALDGQVQLVAAVEANLLAGAISGKGGLQNTAAATTACTRTYTYSADVFSGHCTDQAYAAASYSTSNPTACPQQCTVHAYAYGSKQCGSAVPEVYSENCSLTGTNVSCSAWSYTQFGSTCYQYAFASIHCPQLNNLYLSQSDSGTTCLCGC
jgi:hypothetical protein